MAIQRAGDMVSDSDVWRGVKPVTVATLQRNSSGVPGTNFLRCLQGGKVKTTREVGVCAPSPRKRHVYGAGHFGPNRPGGGWLPTELRSAR